ncbi:MAG: hypothetical protein DHS20C16_22260 [Phycisphaerae bacterium]|nr:MAG: hypothetical protein DHS20C16_22260 [Phycisphaerae bacterium]
MSGFGIASGFTDSILSLEPMQTHYRLVSESGRGRNRIETDAEMTHMGDKALHHLQARLNTNQCASQNLNQGVDILTLFCLDLRGLERPLH